MCGERIENRVQLAIHYEVELMNLYWTTAGIFPMTAEISPHHFEARVKAAASAGFTGIGIWHTDLEHICAELERAGVAAPAHDRKSWVPGPAAEQDVIAFQEQVYGLGIDLELHRTEH